MKLAIVTHGFSLSAIRGGVPTIAKWLRAEFELRGDLVHVHNLPSSSKDPLSRRLLAPSSWRQRIRYSVDAHDACLFNWGANWVELESQRYRPRKELTAALNAYDLIQVVAGGPALALAVSQAKPPKVLQVATTLLMERPAHLPGMPPAKRIAKSLSLPRLHRIEVRALRAMDHVFVENRWMDAWVREQGQPHVTFAPPGIDMDRFRPVGEWDPTRPIIAFGRLIDKRKDWPTAVEAYERFVAATGLGNRLVLAGRGPLDQKLQRKLEASPVRSRITIREDVPAKELPALLAGGSVFLQSSLEEGLGLAGLEAMACGLPVVATATVGASEYVRDGENGFLVPLGGSAERLASGLARVLAGETGRRMSKAAIRTCQEGYAASLALDRFLQQYKVLV